MIKKLVQYIILTFEVVKLNILSSMEYRISFITQVAGMAINDVCWLVMWSIFFSRFPNLNGWSLHDTFLLLAMSMTNFGIFRIFSGNVEEIAHDIAQGHLDYYMTLPKNVLWQISTSRSNISALGDLIFGIVLFWFLGFSWIQFIFFLALCVLTAMILFNFVTIVQSLTFFIGNFEETGDRIFTLVLGICFYPPTTFSGALKFIAFTFLPAFFIVWAPVDLIKFFQWPELLALLGFWLGTLALALWIFNTGLRRYESGNLINLKM